MSSAGAQHQLPYLRQHQQLQQQQQNISGNWSGVAGSSCGRDLQLDYKSAATGLVLGLIALGTVFGNSLVLLAVLLHRSLRSTTAIFVSNLAAADLLLGSCVLPLSSALEVTRGCWLFGTLLCDLWASVDVLCCTASIMSLCAISLDRYIGVTRPLQHARIVTHRRACLLVLCVWLLSFIVSVGPLLGWRKSSSQEEQQQYQCNVSNNPGYILFSVVFSFYLPLAIVVFFYIRIYREAVKQTRFLASGVKTTRARGRGSAAAAATASAAAARRGGGAGGVGGDGDPGGAIVTLRVHRGGGREQRQARLQASDKNYRNEQGKLARFRHEKKAAKTLGIVVGVFILCWLPFFFLYPFKWIFCKSCDIPELAFKVAFWLGYCNSLCNPVIYACWNREFKRAFARILSCRLRGGGGLGGAGGGIGGCGGVSDGGRRLPKIDPQSDAAARQPYRQHRQQVSDCSDGCLADNSYFQKCADCPVDRPQSPLLCLSRMSARREAASGRMKSGDACLPLHA